MSSATLYIAGPVTGNPLARAAFIAAEKLLIHHGYQVASPIHTHPTPPPSYANYAHTPESAPWEHWMRSCLHLITRSDGVALLDGWEASRGASWERRIATEVLGIEAMPVQEWVAKAKRAIPPDATIVPILGWDARQRVKDILSRISDIADQEQGDIDGPCCGFDLDGLRALVEHIDSLVTRLLELADIPDRTYEALEAASEFGARHMLAVRDAVDTLTGVKR